MRVYGLATSPRLSTLTGATWSDDGPSTYDCQAGRWATAALGGAPMLSSTTSDATALARRSVVERFKSSPRESHGHRTFGMQRMPGGVPQQGVGRIRPRLRQAE